MDVSGVAMLHLRRVESRTTIEKVSSDVQKSNACFELGYRPSDIVQANCIIWVEGPSDAIYFHRWISRADKSLKIGLHYSVMWYGGSNRKYLSALEFQEKLSSYTASDIPDFAAGVENCEESLEEKLIFLLRFRVLIGLSR
jgi:hypothetical protein